MSQSHTPLHPKYHSQPSSTQQNKEVEPVSLDHKEYLKPVEQPEISPEVVEYMKQYDATTKKLPKHLKDMGVSSSDEQYDESQGPHLVLSDEKIVAGLQQPINSSWRWLATLMEYLLKQAHITLKMVHGHIKRVLTT